MMKYFNKPCSHNKSADLSRRKFMKTATAGLAILSFPGIATAALNNQTKKPKIIWVLLRGALDSLHTIVPKTSTEYKALRPKLSKSFNGPLLPLSNDFSLHPALVNLHQWYQNKQLLPVVAVSSGYDRRSHFDGQDFLESGLGHIEHDTGWLARAIDIKNKRGLSVSRTTPISLRSSENVYSWFPSKLKSADDDIYQTLEMLYENDEQLSQNLTSGLAVKNIVTGDKNKKKRGKFTELTKACAKLMTTEPGTDCAMLELGGWDTHNNQANRLTRKLKELDDGLGQLKNGLADEWDNTVVIVATEFGRTAKENGTGGTDHGTGSALFLTGGAIKGGKIMGNWPGLATNQLFKERDLMPTSNSFSWIAAILQQHWGFSEKELLEVFPHISAYKDKLV